MKKDNKEKKVEIVEEAKGSITESLRINESEVLHRSFAVRASDVDEKARTIDLSFSSEEPVMRRDANGVYYEVLGHNDGEMDKEFIASGRAPLLLDHDALRQVGVVQSVELSEGKARAKVKFSRSEKATEILADIADGIRGNVSVGYYIREQQEVEERDGLKTMRATLWSPIEVSMVSIPADQSVGVGRAKETESITETKTTDIRSQETMSNENTKPEVKEVDVKAIEKQARASEQARVREISALGSKYSMAAQADEFIKNDKPADEFRGFVLENLDMNARATTVEQPETDPSEIGMSEKEVRQFSFTRAINALANPNSRKAQEAAAFEMEVSQSAAAAAGVDARGIYVPADVLKRDLQATTATQGEEVVAEDLMSGSFIELLRNNMALNDMGISMMSGLQGNVAIPRQDGAATAYWIDPEGSAITAESTQTMDQVTLTPRTVGAYTDYSRQLLLQSSIDVENFVRQDLAAQLALALDVAGLYGTGAGGQPTGLVTAGITKVTAFAAAVPTFAEVVGLETEVATNNALKGSLGYITDFGTRGGLKTTSKAGTEAIFVWDGEEMNGYRAKVSSQVTSGDVFFGNWSDLILGMWGGLDITVDPYSLSTTGNIRVVAFQSADYANRHLESFAYGNDTP